MRKIIFTVAVCLSFMSVFAFVDARTINVRGYYKPSTGGYVTPSYRTSPNSYKFDNYSIKGNYNPFTGKKGTVKPYKW